MAVLVDSTTFTPASLVSDINEVLKDKYASFAEAAGKVSKVVKDTPRKPTQLAADWIEYTEPHIATMPLVTTDWIEYTEPHIATPAHVPNSKWCQIILRLRCGLHPAPLRRCWVKDTSRILYTKALTADHVRCQVCYPARRRHVPQDQRYRPVVVRCQWPGRAAGPRRLRLPPTLPPLQVRTHAVLRIKNATRGQKETPIKSHHGGTAQ